jgi:hypothetical protein
MNLGDDSVTSKLVTCAALVMEVKAESKGCRQRAVVTRHVRWRVKSEQHSIFKLSVPKRREEAYASTSTPSTPG